MNPRQRATRAPRSVQQSAARHLHLAAAAMSLLVAAAASGEEVEVTVTALMPQEGVFVTPVWVGFHDGDFDLFDRQAPASGALERLAEDGNTQPLTDLFALPPASGVQAVLSGAAGPLMSGESVRYVVELDPASHRYLSYATMVVPSNDAFVANDDPTTHRVFDPTGALTEFETTLYGRNVLDAGTEINDEAQSSTAALGQTTANTGSVEGGVISPHPGFAEDGRILNARPNADFSTPGYPLLRLSVHRAPGTTITFDGSTFDGSGDQETPPVTTRATAACRASLNETMNRLSVFCEHDAENAIAAHVHSGVPGENGPVVLPFSEAASPLHQTFDVDTDTAATFLGGGLYVNIHTDANPSGEVRAQMDGCFEGPTGLCLNGRRFQVSSTFMTADGSSGTGRARPATTDSGQFTFFDPNNVEIDIKVLDGCAINGFFWIFIAGLTDVEVDIQVSDSVTGAEQIYSNPLGMAFVTIRDVAAFPCS